jgi:hypothetical protein
LALLSTPVAVEIVPLPSFNDPVHTALALLAIFSSWGFSKIPVSEFVAMFGYGLLPSPLDILLPGSVVELARHWGSPRSARIWMHQAVESLHLSGPPYLHSNLSGPAMGAVAVCCFWLCREPGCG